jgi:hypothetical protein
MPALQIMIRTLDAGGVDPRDICAHPLRTLAEMLTSVLNSVVVRRLLQARIAEDRQDPCDDRRVILTKEKGFTPVRSVPILEPLAVA